MLNVSSGLQAISLTTLYVEVDVELKVKKIEKGSWMPHYGYNVN